MKVNLILKITVEVLNEGKKIENHSVNYDLNLYNELDI